MRRLQPRINSKQSVLVILFDLLLHLSITLLVLRLLQSARPTILAFSFFSVSSYRLLDAERHYESLQFDCTRYSTFLSLLLFFFFLLRLIEAFSKSLLKFDRLLVDVSSFTYSTMQRVLVKQINEGERQFLSRFCGINR